MEDKPVVTMTPGEFLIRYYHGMVSINDLVGYGELNTLLHDIYSDEQGESLDSPYRLNVQSIEVDSVKLSKDLMMINELINLSVKRITDGEDKAEVLKSALEHIRPTLSMPKALDDRVCSVITDVLVVGIVLPTMCVGNSLH